MAIDLQFLGTKLARYREHLTLSVQEVSTATGIPLRSLQNFEAGVQEPTGDEILILADFYRTDYRYFVSSETITPLERTDPMYRQHGGEFSREDRWAVQEFLFLCECEDFLMQQGLGPQRKVFQFSKRGTFYKGQGREAAMGLRRHLGYRANEVPSDVYSDFRRIGLHVFRRQLNNSGISGLFIDHPTVGRCVLVNYTEDVYRQRFTVAHEAGHAILDTEAQFVVSFARDERDFSEFRANAFASNYVIPREFITAIPDPATWDGRKLVEWAGKLKVSTAALAIALKDAGLISQAEVDALRSHRVPAPLKADPELPASLSPAVRARREDYLRRGLSVFYVDLCFRAYEAGVITAGRLAEMLLTTEADLHELARFAGRRLAYGS